MKSDRTFECPRYLCGGRRLTVSLEHDATMPKCPVCGTTMQELFPPMSYEDACEIHEQRRSETRMGGGEND